VLEFLRTCIDLINQAVGDAISDVLFALLVARFWYCRMFTNPPVLLLTVPSYLMINGHEEEGLYRIPGSGKDVKHWQRHFDTSPGDGIELSDEPELYDINAIGSMSKPWQRELLDEFSQRQCKTKPLLNAQVQPGAPTTAG